LIYHQPNINDRIKKNRENPKKIKIILDYEIKKQKKKAKHFHYIIKIKKTNLQLDQY
jgi:hypothetical protein